MKSSFHHRLVNGPFDDPCLYLRFLRGKRAMLFDAGSIPGLSQGDILKISDIFVTHTHIDHFIGFDTVIRALLRREAPLRVFGPAEITDCIEGKLRGYTWNLIKEYPLRIEVFAVVDNTLRHTSFYAENRFRREEKGHRPYTGALLEEEFFRVCAISLSHDIQCLGFSIEEDFQININKAALEEMGLPVGPWLSGLKRAVREDSPGETVFDISGRAFRLDDLRPLAMAAKGQKVSYITDASPVEENISGITSFVRDSDTLYCEAYFLDEDMDRARERNHLTARLAGRIATEGNVKNLVVMHFSPRYINSPLSPEAEAMREYTGRQ